MSDIHKHKHEDTHASDCCAACGASERISAELRAVSGRACEATDSCNDCCLHDQAEEHGHAEGGLGKLFFAGAILYIPALALRLLSEGGVIGGSFAKALESSAAAWAFLAAFLLCFVLTGHEVLIKMCKNIARGRVFDENFLMGIAGIGAFIIGEYPEAVAVMIFYNVGEYLQEKAVDGSKASIKALMDIRPDTALLVGAGGLAAEVRAEDVKIGARILVRPGDRVALDGVIVQGESELDYSALNGESMPRRAAAGDEALAGSVNLSGALTIEVTKSFGESAASRIIALVAEAGSRKSRAENFITRFARVYTPIVCGIALLLAVLPPLLGLGAWGSWVYRGLIFLVVSCPCALVISIPVGFFGGIGGASRKGVLVKGGNYLEALAGLGALVFDKTGTLTYGDFRVRSVDPAEGSGLTEKELLSLAALAEKMSTHPIALSIVSEAGESAPANADAVYTEKPGMGVICEYRSPGAGMSIGACASVHAIAAGNAALMESLAAAGLEAGADGEAPGSVNIAIRKATPGEPDAAYIYAGCVIVTDKVKDDSSETIIGLKRRGIEHIVMLSGDSPGAAAFAAKEIGIEDARGGLLPWQKVEALDEEIKGLRMGSAKKTLAFVGDGINDAPVLARADVGVAMGGLGSDAAIEAADVVLMNDNPSSLLTAIDIARKTRLIVRQNVALALGIKCIVLLLAALGVANMWEAVFADVGVALLCTANAMRARR